jgi:glycosyltransferase involved in cell wall biosynthesis
VARWVNDFFDAFPDRDVVHYSIGDLFSRFGHKNISEWDAAVTLGGWLRQKKMITDDDTYIVDGFWGLGLPPGKNVISVCHGTWARRVKSDIDKGIPMEFSQQMRIQEMYWKTLLNNGGHIVAVSEFAQEDLRDTWGIPSETINNSIDTTRFRPYPRIHRDRPIIIHGVTSKVKAADHIEFLKKNVNADIWLLDEASQKLNLPKYEALAQADVVVIPSHYEGNSYFTLEALACNVPIVCYDVGMPWWAYRNGWQYKAGNVLSYDTFSKETTLDGVNDVLSEFRDNMQPRELASLFSPSRFRDEWKSYLDRLGR